jgi:hypothetical protein
MYETDEICSKYHLVQDGETMIAKAPFGELHITEEESTLRVYMSTKSDTQALCYFSKLPQALVAWIMTDPETKIQNDIDPAAASIVKSVLNAPESILELILQAEGIVGVDFADKVGDEEHEKGVKDGMARPTNVQPPIDTRRRFRSSNARRSLASTSNSLANLSIHTAIARIWPDLPPSYYEEPEPVASTPELIHTDYLQLLNRCILAGSVAELPAHGRNSFPLKGSFDMTKLFRALSQDQDSFGSGMLDFMQDDDWTFKVGAAGELYVSLHNQRIP